MPPRCGRLVLWARRWCPWTAGDGLTATGGAGLVLDTTGSDHLWGGEAGVLEEIEGSLGVARPHRRAALGADPRRRLGAGPVRPHVRERCAPEDLAARLAPLPVRALRLDERDDPGC